LRDPLVIAHRGYSAVAPENTLAAIAAAARCGADWTEIDVAVSLDGVPYLLHDTTVDRTTSGTGALVEQASPALDALDAGAWFSPAFAGQRLPRLEAALALGAPLLVELKAGPVEPVVALLAPVADRVIVQSFDERVLRAVAALAPELRLGLLRVEPHDGPAGTAFYNPRWDFVSAELVQACHAEGVAVWGWTADDPAAWAALCEAGADGIITNRPGALVGWLSGR
jgi:glycerophosphoryl diester phosphodiesterase